MVRNVTVAAMLLCLSTTAVAEDSDIIWQIGPNPNKVTFSPPAEARVEAGAAGPVFSSARLRFKTDMFNWATMEVVLYENEKRLDFVFRLDKKMTYVKEAVYLSFPIAGTAPQFRYEIGGGNVRPNEDHYPGACRD